MSNQKPAPKKPEPTHHDLIGDIKESDAAVAKAPKIGQMVFYCQNNPNEEGLLIFPAVVTKVNLQSVSLQVFMETHVQPCLKIPLALVPTPGYYFI